MKKQENKVSIPKELVYESITNCPTCNSPVILAGNTTKYYLPIDPDIHDIAKKIITVTNNGR